METSACTKYSFICGFYFIIKLHIYSERIKQGVFNFQWSYISFLSLFFSFPQYLSSFVRADGPKILVICMKSYDTKVYITVCKWMQPGLG